MNSKTGFAVRCIAMAAGLVLASGSHCLAGPLYTIADLGEMTDQERPKLISGHTMEIDYVADTAGRIVSEFDKTPVALPQEYAAPYGEKWIEDGNIHGRFVGTEASYQRPKRPEPGHVAIDLILLQHHAALVSHNLHHWTDLHALFANKGWDLETADAIDDQGRIAGTGLLHGVEHAYLLIPKGLKSRQDFPETAGTPSSQEITGMTQPTPVPEPTTLAFFGVAMVLGAVRSRLASRPWSFEATASSD